MNNADANKSNTLKPGSIKRKTISTTQADLTRSMLLLPPNPLPLLIEPAREDIDFISWVTNNRAFIQTHLLQHGAILFRAFRMNTVEAFEQFIQTVCGNTLEYQERSSPRNQVSGNVYTSTEYPADQQIFLHNENSYQRSWPLKIFFFCITPAQQGGETPLANVQKVLEHIDPSIRERFIQKQWMYVRNFRDGLGLPWQTVFQTADQSVVDAYCREHGIETEWVSHRHLRTRAIRPAVVRHPQTGALLWFNHALFFHISALEPSMRKALLAEFREQDLPTNTYYGDGSPIEADVLDTIRSAYQQETIAFPWKKGDILMVDNMLVAHGRSPFTGTRKVVVGMADPFQREHVS